MVGTNLQDDDLVSERPKKISHHSSNVDQAKPSKKKRRWGKKKRAGKDGQESRKTPHGTSVKNTTNGETLEKSMKQELQRSTNDDEEKEAANGKTSEKTLAYLPGELLTEVVEMLIPDGLEAASLDIRAAVCHRRSRDVQNFRRVCRSFRNASWRALGEVIECTTFDVRSWKSRQQLLQISKEPYLAKCVKSLTFGCGRIDTPALIDLMAHLGSIKDPRAMKALSASNLRVQDGEWIRVSEQSSSKYSKSPQTSDVELLASALAKLPNLRSISYRDCYIAPKYRGLCGALRKVPAGINLTTAHALHTALSEMCDLAIIFSALLTASVFPQDLTFPAPLNWQTAVAALGQPEVLEFFFSNVRHLHMIQQNGTEPHLKERRYVEYKELEWVTSQVTHLELSRYMVQKSNFFVPSWKRFEIQTSFPSLTHLTFRQCFIDRLRWEQFMIPFSPTLKSLTFSDCVVGLWSFVLHFLKDNFHLDDLEINFTVPKSYDSERVMLNIVLPPEILFLAAKNITLSPRQYHRAVADWWNEDDVHNIRSWTEQ